MHEPAGPAFLVWLETTGLAVAMRQWLWLYPIVEIVHILGFVVLVGSVAMFDLRLLGVSPRLPVSALARHLLARALGRVPIEGSVAEVSGLKLVAESLGGRRNRIDTLLVCRVHPVEAPEGEEIGERATGATVADVPEPVEG